jgi:small subunit ribosomal protein S13
MTEQKQTEQKFEGKLVRVLSKDIEGKLKLYVGLTKIKGISWAFANAICKNLGFDKNKKIGSLSKEEIEKINSFVKKPNVPEYLLNRRKDFETGENKQMVGNDLELQKEFDIGRLKKIKSYRGQRHVLGLPMRGQRTRSHFRKNKKKGVGIKNKGKKEEKTVK